MLHEYFTNLETWSSILQFQGIYRSNNMTQACRIEMLDLPLMKDSSYMAID